jgi:hypothetical protein
MLVRSCGHVSAMVRVRTDSTRMTAHQACRDDDNTGHEEMASTETRPTQPTGRHGRSYVSAFEPKGETKAPLRFAQSVASAVSCVFGVLCFAHCVFDSSAQPGVSSRFSGGPPSRLRRAIPVLLSGVGLFSHLHTFTVAGPRCFEGRSPASAGSPLLGQDAST